MKILESNKIDEKLKALDITSLPITTNTFTWFPLATIIYLLLNVLSLLMPGVMILTFYSIAIKTSLFPGRAILIFIDVFAWWGMYIISSLLFGKLFLIILKLIHSPREGLFEVKKNDKDYFFYCLRMVVKKNVFWVWNNFCFPWASNLAFKILDISVDFKSTLFDGWCDLEFIDFGKNMMVGQGAVVFSSIILRIDDRLSTHKKGYYWGPCCLRGTFNSLSWYYNWKGHDIRHLGNFSYRSNA